MDDDDDWDSVIESYGGNPELMAYAMDTYWPVGLTTTATAVSAVVGEVVRDIEAHLLPQVR